MNRVSAIRFLCGRVPTAQAPPAFLHGDVVRTKVGSRGDRVVRTEVEAKVRLLGFHGVRRQWVYYLDGNSRPRHRWYLAEDLELVAQAAEIDLP